jgi:hypothetical protein
MRGENGRSLQATGIFPASGEVAGLARRGLGLRVGTLTAFSKGLA